MKNILYITLLNPLDRAGLYNATINRMNVNGLLYSILYREPHLIKFVKKGLGKKIYYENETYKLDNNNLINFLYIKRKNFNRYINEEDINIIVDKLFNVVCESKIEIIHAHWSYPQGYIAYKLSEKSGIPFVVTYHGTDIHTLPYKNSKIKTAIKTVLNNANMNIFVSNDLCKQAKNIGYDGERSIVIHNGIDSSVFYLNRKENDTFTIIYIGSLNKVKNADKLPVIFNYINKKLNKKVNYYIAGDGPLKKFIHKEAKKMNLEIEFLGHISQKEVAKILNKSDVILLPSQKEGWGSVIIEAYACGVIAVGTNVGGIPEAIGKYGYIVEYKSGFEKEIADIIYQINEKKYDREKLAEYSKKFKWEIIRKEINNVYKSLINS